MLTSSEIIYKHLKKFFIFSIQGSLDSKLVYSRPILWTGSERLENHCIYICLPDNTTIFPQKLTSSIILTTNTTPAANIISSDNFVFLFNDLTSLLQAHNSLNELFGIFENWNLALSNLLNQDYPINELIKCSHNIFQNPILIHNRDFEFIAYSDMIDNDSSLSFLIGAESSQEAYRDFLLNSDFQKTFLQTAPCFFPDTCTGIKSLYFNIFSDNVFIARIVIPEVTQELCESDKSLLLHFAKYVQTSIARQHISDFHQKLFTLNQLISLALNDDLNEDSYFESAMKIFYWENTHEYFCAIFSIDKPDQNSSYKIITDAFEKSIPASSIIEYNHKLVMYVNLTLNGHSQSDVIAQCTELARDNYLKIGCSRTYIGFSHSFQLLFKQAEIALSYGTRYMPQRWNHYFNNITSRYLLEKMISDLPADMVCMPEVVDIYHYDLKHQTNYFITLKEYLAHNMQPVSTAKALYIHRTSLIYRLEKITELFNLSFSNPEDRVFIQLSILLIEFSISSGYIEH